MNGNVYLQSDGSTTNSIYSCEAGYALVGSNTGICSVNGTWDIETPSCGRYNIY